MTELDIIREYQATKFYQLVESGADPGTEVTEIESGTAFEAGVAEWDTAVETRAVAPELPPDDDFEPVP